MTKFINVNGELILEEAYSISAASRSVFYGDGCFETFVSYKGKFLHFEDHFIRLQSSLEYLEMNASFNEEKLKAEIFRLLEKNGDEHEDIVVRVQCYREGNAGYMDISERSGSIISTRSVSYGKELLNLKTVSIRAIPSEALERKVKLSNSINYIKAAQEAKKKGGDDALMLTMNQKISETTIANIFWIKGNQVCTPSKDCDLLPGVTRAIIKEIVNKNSELELIEGEFELSSIYESEAVFCCNSVMEVKPVSMLNDHSFDIAHELVLSISQEFQNYKRSKLKQ